MDFDNRIIRECARQKLNRVLADLRNEEGKAGLVKEMKSLVQTRRLSRAGVARHFGIISAQTEEELEVLDRLYTLINAPLKAHSRDYRDLVDDTASFFVVAYWMRVEDAMMMLSTEAVQNAAARLFTKGATWPHGMLTLSVIVESGLVRAYAESEGLVNSPPMDEDIDFLVGVVIIMAAFAALRFDLSRASPEYVRWECVMLLQNLGVADNPDALRQYFESLGDFARITNVSHLLTPCHYEICRQYRLAFESPSYGMNRVTATHMALNKLVAALDGAARTDTAYDASMKWSASMHHIHSFISASVVRSPIERLIHELEAGAPLVDVAEQA